MFFNHGILFGSTIEVGNIEFPNSTGYLVCGYNLKLQENLFMLIHCI
jgi:hypothetical protein